MSEQPRRQGVEFGDLDDALEEYEYPTTVQKLVDDCGQYEIELEDGTKSVETVLKPYLSETDGVEEGESFDSAEAVRDAVMNLVGSDAVGREEYSDRGLDSDETDGSEESI